MRIRHDADKALAGIKKRLTADRDRRNAAIVRKVALTALSKLQELSPVDTGLYRGSHQLSIGQPVAAPDGGSSPEGRIAEAQTALASIQKLSGTVSIYLSNPLPYATNLETGSSLQAPDGVYAIVRDQIPGIVKDAIAEAQSGGQDGGGGR